MKRTYTTLPYTEYTTADGRFDSNRATIDTIVLHSTAGTLQSAISLFENTPAKGKETSTHYIIDNQGKLYAGLEEYLVAYSAGNYPVNQRSIAIEHVDEGPNVKLHTDAQYAMSAKLVKDICTFYNIPIDSNHIKPHNAFSATACPNGLDVARIIREASGTIPTVDDCPAKLIRITAERDRLNGVIAGKDNEIKTCTSSLASVTAEKNALAVQLDACQRTTATYKEAYDALPKLKEELVYLSDAKLKMDGEISELTKQVGYWQTKFNNLKKPGLKFIQAAVIALCEKMGVSL